MTIREAAPDDVPAIVAVLRANRDDRSLFQQKEAQVRRSIADFLVAIDETDAVEGCAALHWHTADNVEILAVAVIPQRHGRGTGNALVKACIERAVAIERHADRRFLWLATAKPDYFARFRFRATSRFRLPIAVLWTKFLLVFQQPFARWLPALVGRHTFMRFTPGG
jgi:amino-acid N-acetyltransferase